MIYIVLPAYNEALAIGALLDKIQLAFESEAEKPRVLVVDDGSSDGTADIVRAHPLAASGQAEVVPHEHNKGLGAAIRTGVETFLARSGGDDILVTLDADDTHNPEVIKQLVAETRKGADVAIASRFQPGGQEVGVSAIRKIISRGAKVFMSIVAPVPGARDYTCGFRAYARPILVRAKQVFGDKLVESNHFSVMSELLIKLSAIGAKVTEVPFILRYDLKQGPSKIKFSATIMGYFSLITMNMRAKRLARSFREGGNRQ